MDTRCSSPPPITFDNFEWEPHPATIVRHGGYEITVAWLERHYGPIRNGDYVRAQLGDGTLRVFVNDEEVDYGDDLPYTSGYLSP
jgi:hypothetical protein